MSTLTLPVRPGPRPLSPSHQPPASDVLLRRERYARRRAHEALQNARIAIRCGDGRSAQGAVDEAQFWSCAASALAEHRIAREAS